MKNVPVAISCLTNALIGGKRYEMLSSRAYRCNWVYAIAVLDGIFGAGHCLDCYHFERDNFDGIQD
jgi:hypothetical protein